MRSIQMAEDHKAIDFMTYRQTDIWTWHTGSYYKSMATLDCMKIKILNPISQKSPYF